MVKDKYLVLKGCAGLGNRLMAICNAIKYCRKGNRKLLIDWSDGVFSKKGVNIFHKYFEVRNFPVLDSLESIEKKLEYLSCYPSVFKKNIFSGGYDNFVHACNPFFLKIPKRLLVSERFKMLRGFWMDKSRYNENIIDSKWKFLKEIFRPESMPLGCDLNAERGEDVVFYFDFTPNDLKNIFLENIFLKKDIETKINSFSQQHKLQTNTIGIHIRSTDKRPRKSLDELFKKISKFKLSSPQFFLATDNKQIAATIKRTLSPVIEYPKLMPDLKTEGMHQWAKYNDQLHLGDRILEESIMDMWLLSKCEYLLYQGNSTFSILSRFMHQDITKTEAWDR